MRAWAWGLLREGPRKSYSGPAGPSLITLFLVCLTFTEVLAVLGLPRCTGLSLVSGTGAPL